MRSHDLGKKQIKVPNQLIEYELTKTKKDEELNYWALILYGDGDKVTGLTGKLSLYR